METKTVRMDNVKLKEITNASHTSIITMLLLALRIRDRGFSNITATKEQLIRMGEKVVDEDFLKFWRDLQTAGIGSIVYGRRGRPDRFQWHYSLKNVARVAIEGKEHEVAELAKRKPKRNQAKPVAKKTRAAKPTARPVSNHVVRASVPAAKAALAAPAPQVERVMQTIQLRDGSIAEIILPKEVSKNDLERIKLALSR